MQIVLSAELKYNEFHGRLTIQRQNIFDYINKDDVGRHFAFRYGCAQAEWLR